MAETTITTTGTTTTTTSETTTTTSTTTTKTSPFIAYYKSQIEKYKKGELDFEEAPAAETATTTEAPAPGAIAPAEVTPLQKMQNEHEAAVNFCIELESYDFAELIRYAQFRNNKFPAYVVELRNVVNADDVYKDAVTRICSPLGEEVTRKALKLVDSKKILDLSEYLKHVKVIVEEWGEV